MLTPVGPRPNAKGAGSEEAKVCGGCIKKGVPGRVAMLAHNQNFPLGPPNRLRGKVLNLLFDCGVVCDGQGQVVLKQKQGVYILECGRVHVQNMDDSCLQKCNNQMVLNWFVALKAVWPGPHELKENANPFQSQAPWQGCWV